MENERKRSIIRELAFLDFLYRRYGEKLLDDITEYEISRMERIWQKIGDEQGRGVTKLVEILWQNMCREDGMQFSIKTVDDGEIAIRCTYCPYAEVAREHGFEKVAYAKYCMSDYGIATGFDTGVLFSRTRTLMEGHDICNHHYKTKKE